MQQTTSNYVETHFKEMCRQVIEDQDVLLVTQEEADNVVMMPQSIFNAWKETVYLIKSPANAVMLEKSIAKHQTGQTFEHYLIKKPTIDLIFGCIQSKEDGVAYQNKMREE
jgi:antitoxin YefM